VRPHVRLGCEVTGAAWDEQARCWQVQTTTGLVSARLLVAGVGPLAEPRIPQVPGLETFGGTMFHSASWNHEHDLRGRRVASIGTGASAIQLVPAIQARGRAALCRPAHRAVGAAALEPSDHSDRAAPVPAAARATAPGPRRYLRRARAAHAGLRQTPPADAGARAARPAPHAHPGPGPRPARAGDAELHDRLQADPALQPLVSGGLGAQRRAAHWRPAGDQGDVDRDWRRGGGRGRHDHLRHRLQGHRDAGRKPVSPTSSCCWGPTRVSGTTRWST
jgi:L-lysine 6-monooxygenase (NADPH-requiring)